MSKRGPSPIYVKIAAQAAKGLRSNPRRTDPVARAVEDAVAILGRVPRALKKKVRK